MENKKKTVITVETWQRIVLTRQQTKTVWCEHCAAQVEMLSPEQAAFSVGKNERIIFRQIENGELHFAETPEGKILICGVSLLTGNYDQQKGVKKLC